MSRVAILNGGAMGLALVLSVAMAWRPTGSGRRSDDASAPEERASLEPAQRIVSASTVVDRLLLDLCAPGRIAALTAHSAEGPDGHRYLGRPTIRSLEDVETIVSLRPDLVFTHNVADARRVERLREAGLRVVDLGPLEGMDSLREDIVAVASACDAVPAGRRYATALERRMAAVAADVPAAEHRRGIYLGVYGDRYFGGTLGTSYHDVLLAAGLRDAAAADGFTGWPQYAIEQLLEIDPEIIVTRRGMRASICEHPTLRALRACTEGSVVELDEAILDDPGPGMLDAAEAIRAAVYPR